MTTPTPAQLAAYHRALALHCQGAMPQPSLTDDHTRITWLGWTTTTLATEHDVALTAGCQA